MDDIKTWKKIYENEKAKKEIDFYAASYYFKFPYYELYQTGRPRDVKLWFGQSSETGRPTLMISQKNGEEIVWDNKKRYNVIVHTAFLESRPLKMFIPF